MHAATQSIQLEVTDISVIKITVEPFGVSKPILDCRVVMLVGQSFCSIPERVVAPEAAALAHGNSHQGVRGRTPKFLRCLQLISYGELTV